MLAGVAMLQKLVFPIILRIAPDNWTFVGLLTIVSSLVVITISDRHKPGIAMLALVRFYTGVCTIMDLKMQLLP